MATNIGTGPQDIPLNQFLGEMAFMDNQIEFGTWEPQITNLGDHTRNDAACGGFYQKIGKMVYVLYNYGWTNRSTTNGGYGVRINNLPWKCDTTIPVRARGSTWVGGVENVIANVGAGDEREHFGGYIDSTDIMFRVSGSRNGESELSLDGSVATTSLNGYIYGGAVYITTGERHIT